MTAIWKFPLKEWERQHIAMPRFSKIIRLGVQNGAPCLLAEVDPDAPKVQREFFMFGTGHPLSADRGDYVGSFDLPADEYWLVFHVYSPANQDVEMPSKKQREISAFVITCNGSIEAVFIGTREDAEVEKARRAYADFDHFRNMNGVDMTMKRYRIICYWAARETEIVGKVDNVA